MRARNIKPGLFKNEILGTSDPLLTILFEGLWCLADKSGRLEDRPARIKAEVFPYREGLDINRYLTDLERLGFVQRYVIERMNYIQVLKFDEHQHPHHTEKRSKIPPPPPHKPLGDNDNGYLTVKEPEINRHTPSDSLIPDSLIPDSRSCSGSMFSNGELTVKTSVKQKTRNNRKTQPSIEEWIENLRKDPTYSHVDIDTEIGKMKQWLSLPKNQKRKLTPQFLLNWINKIEKPLGGSYVATTAGNISIPKTFREIDDERERKARRQFLLLGEKQDDQDPDHPSILDLGEEDPF